MLAGQCLFKVGSQSVISAYLGSAVVYGGFDVYVDSVSGNNANSGTSPSQAKKDLSAIGTISAGMSIGLAKGSYWREKLTISVDNVTVKSYGSGDRPVLDCADVVPNANFTKTGGYTNIYQVSLAVDPDPLAAEWPGIWINGVRATFSASLAALDTAPGTFYYSAATDLTTIVLYVNSIGSTNPISDGKLYEASIRRSGINSFDGQYVVIDGIEGRRNYSSYGSLTVGRYGIIKNCVAREGNTHNIYMRAFSNAYDCATIDAYNHTTSPTQWIVHENVVPGADATATLTRCSASCETYTSGMIGFYNHKGSGPDWLSINLVDFSSNNINNPISSANTTTLNVTGGTLTNLLNVFSTNGQNINASGLNISGVQTGGHMGNFSGNNLTYVFDNITATWGTTGHIRALGTGCSFTLKNSHITSPNTVILTTVSGSTNTFTVTDNEFTPAGRMSVVYDITGTHTVISDRNNFGGATGKWRYNGTDYLTLAAWRAFSGQDLNSLP